MSCSSRVCRARSGGGRRIGQGAGREPSSGKGCSRWGLRPESSPSSDGLDEPSDLGEHRSSPHEDGWVDAGAIALGLEDEERVGLGDGAVLGGAFD